MTDDKTWERSAALHSADARLDGNSRRLIRSENPTAAEASPRTVTKRRQEDPVLKLIFRLESSIALDTVRNEYLLHQKLHTWFASATAPSDVEKLNERVYTELFLTPSSDPWIGLVPAGTYTGLNNGGVE